eukprot:Skav227329  [mRNA]  locus=scaffold2964:74870:76455:- [translate_table: standard]
MAILSRLKPGKDDRCLVEQSLDDASQGFCTQPLSASELQRLLKGAPYRLIPRHVITQSSGKQRVIDDGHLGGQSERSSDANKLTLCSALRPAQHIALAMRRWSPAQLALFREGDSWETGQEDLPSAYRFCPVNPVESRGCIVVWWHDTWQQPAFQIYAGLLFGLPLAVTSFNRCSKLLEALARRFGKVLLSMYFDDASITDLRCNKGSAQWTTNVLFELVQTHGHVTFWARERLHQKIQGIIDEAKATNTLSRGSASKLYGIANFLEQGIYGRVGYGGLMAVKDRQTESSKHLTEELRACFEVIEAVTRMEPRREFPVLPFDGLRFLAASDDAAIEEEAPGSGGFHLIFFQADGSQLRQSFVAANCAELRALWQPAVTHIAQLELSMVLFALLVRPELFRNRQGLWFLDNVAAVMTLVRGSSTNSDLAQLGHLIHLALFALRAQGYWEYVQSKSNWADDISRLGFSDPWWRTNGFSFSSASLPTFLFRLPFAAVILVFEFL